MDRWMDTGQMDGKIMLFLHTLTMRESYVAKKVKRKVQGVPQSQTSALPRHQEKEETDKTKQAQVEQTQEKH